MRWVPIIGFTYCTRFADGFVCALEIIGEKLKKAISIFFISEEDTLTPKYMGILIYHNQTKTPLQRLSDFRSR
jgi:hypothetical protein